jgi:hypothetical protein
MSEYYDVPVTLNVVIAVTGETKREAEEKLYRLDDEDLICLLAEQVHFMDMPDDTTVQ